MFDLVVQLLDAACYVRRMDNEQFRQLVWRVGFEVHPGGQPSGFWTDGVLILKENELYVVSTDAPVTKDWSHMQEYYFPEERKDVQCHPFKNLQVHKYDMRISQFSLVKTLNLYDLSVERREAIMRSFCSQECDSKILQRLWDISLAAQNRGDLKRYSEISSTWKIRNDDRFPNGWIITRGTLAEVLTI